MHRLIEITVAPEITSKLKPELLMEPKVIGISIHTGVSEKPRGDLLQVHVLNSGADNVLGLVLLKNIAVRMDTL